MSMPTGGAEEILMQMKFRTADTSPEKIFPSPGQIRLIALDLDGTLLTSDKRLTQRNREALSAAAAAGIEIVPATGRFYSGMPEDVRALDHVRYCILINGALVIDSITGEKIYTAEIDTQDALAFFEYLDDLPVIYDCYIDSWGYMTGSMQEKAGEYISNIHSLKMVRELRKPVPELKRYILEGGYRPQKLQLFTRNDVPYRDYLLHELAERFPDFSVTSSLPNNIEVNSSAADKGLALKALADHLGISRSGLMAFGDSLNDIPMLRAAAWGVAMGNAHPAATEAAVLQTASCDEDGVAVIVEELLKIV